MQLTTRLTLMTGFLLLAAGPLWAYQTDQGIEASISNSYVFTNYLSNDNITVHSNGGAVTLTGTVATDNDKFLAQNTAENQPQVKSVDNELQVKEPVPAQYSDAWIGMKVKAALLFHQNVSAVTTRVDVKDGVVTLDGTANNRAQIDLTTEYARDIYGVKEVRNRMEIRPTNPPPESHQPVDDGSITAQIKLTLLLHRSTSALHTHVKTQDGVVTLWGTADNDAEKSLVTKLAMDISGVKRVSNNMNVKP